MTHLFQPNQHLACTPSGLEHVEIVDPERALHIAMQLIQEQTRIELCKLTHEARMIFVLHTGNLSWPKELQTLFSGITNRNQHSIENTENQATILLRASDLQLKILGYMLSHPDSTIRRSLANLSDQATSPLYSQTTDPFLLSRTMFSLPSAQAITGENYSMRPDSETTIAHCSSIIRELRKVISCIPRKEQLWKIGEGTIIIAPEDVVMHKRDGKIMNGQILPHADTDGGTIIFGKPAGDVHPRRMLVSKY